MHVKGVEEQMRLMAHAFSEALKLSFVEVVLQDGSIIGMRALLDNLSGSFAGRHASDVR